MKIRWNIKIHDGATEIKYKLNNSITMVNKSKLSYKGGIENIKTAFRFDSGGL